MTTEPREPVESLEARARRVLDTNAYLVLGTADATGLPWTTPVYFSMDGYAELYWVSSPDARHSRNIVERPDVSVAVFDSSVRVGGAEAVYARAAARVVPADDPGFERAAAIFNARQARGATELALDELRGDPLSVYRASVREAWVLIRGGDPDFGVGIDSRRSVDLT